MRSVVISVDYEIFGNGSGDVRQHIIEPANRMARLCAAHGAPLTVFLEAEEYFAFKNHAKALKRDLGYDPGESIQAQAVQLLRDGHDIQLHLHPEWHGARYENGKWRLRPEKMTVDSLFETQEEVTEYIRQRKGLLEELTSMVDPARSIRAYRAGAFSAQPGRKLLAGLAENGFVLDSSVVKGLEGGERGYDYRAAPCAKGPWRVREDVIHPDPCGPLWEFPIYSVMGRRFQQLTLSRLRAKFSKNVPKDKQMEMVAQLGFRPRDPFGLLKFLWRPVPIKLDYHNVSAAKLMGWIRSAPAPRDGRPDVVMLIGHTKEHISDSGLEALLGMIARDESMEIISLNDLVERIEQTDVSPAAQSSRSVRG